MLEMTGGSLTAVTITTNNVLAEPPLFDLAWRAREFEVLAYWVRIEANSERIEPQAKRRWLPLPFALQRKLPWWLWFVGLVYAFRRWPGASVALGGLAVGLAQLDLGIVGLACLAGLTWGACVRRPSLGQRVGWLTARVALFATAFVLSAGLSAWLARVGN